MNAIYKINKYRTKLNIAQDHKKIEMYKKKLMMYGGCESSDKTDEVQIPLVKIIDLKLSENDNEIIKKIVIKEHHDINIYYDKNKISTQIEEFVKNMGDNKKISKDLTEIIVRIIKKIIKEQDEESAIIWLRSNEYLKADPKFRWHRDGSYFASDTKKPIYKFAVSLKGESTPVVTDKNAIERFDCVQKKKYKIDENLSELANSMNLSHPIDVMIELDKFIAPALIEAIGNKYIKAEYGHGVYFLNKAIDSDGRLIKGAIHSEPEIQKDRLFLAILPGPKNKCKNWIEKKKY